ncbi:hypothetical protein CSA37_13175, partial [Candidatus Fermentibacteria bacterium]
GPTGSSLSGFPVDLGTWTDDGVSIGDIDSDSHLELVIAGMDGRLHAINHDGSSTGGFPVTVSTSNSLSGQPALGDIDGDGRLEIVFGEQNTGILHCYEMGDNTAFNYLPWPQFQHDAGNTGYFPTDNDPPGAPSNLSETHTWDGDIVKVNLSWTLSPDDPGDVINYRIFGHTPFEPAEEVGVVPAGTTSYFHRMGVYEPYDVARYYLKAFDGVHESQESNDVRIPKPAVNNLALGCPVREIYSVAPVTSRTTAALPETAETLTDETSPPRGNCGILTDGEFIEIYTPSPEAECIEIDLGAVFRIDGVVSTGTSLDLSEIPVYELSSDGRNFSRIAEGSARYVRVYGVGGKTEVEILGETILRTTAPVELTGSDSDGFRIASAEGAQALNVTVFDLSGRSVWNGSSVNGEIIWNSENSSGSRVPSGIYLLLIEAEDSEPVTAKVIVR